AEYGAPVLLFSGGEPLMHPRVFELMERAVRRGLRAVLSSIGLQIDGQSARRLAGLGFSYVGISLDGLAAAHDRFRRCPGAFERTLRAIAAASEAGLKVGLRFTISRRNVQDLGGVFDLLERENIPRICFYHLVGSGRGRGLAGEALSAGETRQAVDFIAARTEDMHARGLKTEVLTVDNHADGPYLYLKMKAAGLSGASGAAARAKNILELLRLNGGNGSGKAIGAVSWNGEVYPDQFWRSVKLGSVRERPFAEIWHDGTNALLTALKNKPAHVTGRCRGCVFLDCCGGNLRARAEAATGRTWGVDPACYLTDEEISTPL
ncbi:MAG: radical SAM protein, partial [Candidatus Adiutrix sp.]|nr:radical SAM protein [Candidatus Adiutrix sp.]